MVTCEVCGRPITLWRDITTKQYSVRCEKCLKSTRWYYKRGEAITAWLDKKVVDVSFPADGGPIAHTKG